MCHKETVGVVYIMTNTSYSEIRVGYADDLKKEIKKLNDNWYVPGSFEAYAAYEVEERFIEEPLYNIINLLDSNLSVGNNENKIRKAGFYNIKKEDAYDILSNIAKLSDTEERLHHTKANGEYLSDKEIVTHTKGREKKKAERNDVKRRDRFSFAKCGISPGEKIVFIENPNCVAVVKDEYLIKYEGEDYSISKLTKKLKKLDPEQSIRGTLFWTYKDIVLNTLREELEKNDKYK